MIRKAEVSERRPPRKGPIELTGETPLSARFVTRVQTALDAVARHGYFTAFAEERTVPQMRKALLGCYATVEAFPRFMGAILSRLEPGAHRRAGEARGWLMQNIAVEEKHREWWIEMGEPVGLAADDFAAHQPSLKMAAQGHYLYLMSHAAPLGEAIAAVNYAVEGATGIWARELAGTCRPRLAALGLPGNSRALRWLDVHAHYDDLHPVEALEVVKMFCADERSMDRAANAAVRSLEYYQLALDDALDA